VISVMGCVYILFTAPYLEFKAMFGANVRIKCNYAALRKSSNNQQQHLFLGQWWIIGNTIWLLLATSSQRRILDLRN